MRRALSIGTAMGMALSAHQVFAQSADNAMPQTDGIEEIVVTAQRKEETAQRAGIAIDVISGNTLLEKGVTSASDLGKIAPSLTIARNGGANTVLFVRGVGNFTVNGYSDPAIAFNYDGVYLGRPTSTTSAFFDLQRIEVLKGPQGTLYGRNATGGAINVIPARPVLGEFSGFVNASYGNYDAKSLQGAINVPMGENGALRVSGAITRRDGFNDDGTSDDRSEALRVQMMSELTPNLTVRVAADYTRSGGIGAGSDYIGSFQYNPVTRVDRFVLSGLPVGTGLFSPRSQAYRQTLFNGAAGRTAAPLDDDIYQNNRLYGANAEITWKTDLGTLTVLPAWRYSDLDNKFGVPAFIGYIQEKDEQFSLEARFAGERVGIFDYILGAYYYDESVKGNYTFGQQSLNAYQTFQSDTKSYALFSRLTANIGDRLRAIGGIRYTHDKKDFAGQADVFIVRCNVVVAGRPNCPTVPLLPVTDSAEQLPAPFVLAPAGQARPIGATGAVLIHAATPVDTGLTKSKITWRAGAEFDVTPTSLLYASVETGFRSGGFSLAQGYETFAPEYITAYTVGLKNRFFNNRVQLNIEGFLWKYRDQQINHTGIDTAGNQGQFTENAGKSTNKGFEVEAQFKATRTTLLGAQVQYLDTEYSEFTYQEPVGAAPPITGCPYTVTGSTNTINCAGFPAYQAPRWTINLKGEQTIPVGDYKFVLSADTQYKSSNYTGFQFLPQFKAPSNWVSNASVTFSPESSRWSIGAFVRNIENNRIITAGQLYASLRSITGVYSAPRTYGVQASAKF